MDISFKLIYFDSTNKKSFLCDLHFFLLFFPFAFVFFKLLTLSLSFFVGWAERCVPRWAVGGLLGHVWYTWVTEQMFNSCRSTKRTRTRMHTCMHSCPYQPSIRPRDIKICTLKQARTYMLDRKQRPFKNTTHKSPSVTRAPSLCQIGNVFHVY